MSLADFLTVEANSTASGELCLALQEMRTAEDTESGGGGGAQRLYLVAIHLDVGNVTLNVLTQDRSSEVSKN